MTGALIAHRGRVYADNELHAVAKLYAQFPRAAKIVMMGPVNAEATWFEYNVFLLEDSDSESSARPQPTA